jgi:hypothetical protein
MRDTYEAVVKEFGGKLNRAGIGGLLRSLGVGRGDGSGDGGGGSPSAERGGSAGGGVAEGDAEPLELLWGEMGLPEGMPVRAAGLMKLGLGDRWPPVYTLSDTDTDTQ